jgi:hypothetical protein
LLEHPLAEIHAPTPHLLRHFLRHATGLEFVLHLDDAWLPCPVALGTSL